MMRSMFAGVSGLKAHQTRMDVIGNNIANVNTAGYKSSRATFQDMLSQTIRAATAPTASRGGTNAVQVGLGVTLGSIDVKHTQGNTQSTGHMTDLAIEGDGFFVLGQGEQKQYTRAGIFGLDNGTEGNLVSLVNGMRVMGYKADSTGAIDLNSPIEPLYISAADTISPKATTKVNFAGNLDNRYTTGKTVSRSIQVYDSRGREQTVEIDFEKSEGNQWTWKASWLLTSNAIPSHGLKMANNATYTVVRDGGDGGDGATWELRLHDDPDTKVATSTDGRVWTALDEDEKEVEEARFEFERELLENTNNPVVVSGSDGAFILTQKIEMKDDQGNTHPGGTITFNTDGTFSGVDNNTISFKPELADPINIQLDFTSFTHYADTFTGKFMSQDGYTNGALESFAIDQNGRIIGSFSNGLTRALGQVALARFANPAGLERTGSTMFGETPNSGDAQIGAAGIPGFGSIAPSSLEMSNVDLSEEFTEMIITQRGFQANSRIITSSDEMLQELVNLKR